MPKRPALFYILMVIAMITWGISWASGKILAPQAIPEVLLFWRFFFTFLSLIPIVYLVEKNLKIQKESLLFILTGGIIMSLYNYLFFQGLHNGLAGSGGVLVTTMNPVFTFIIISLINKNKPHLLETAGLLIGLAGGMIMIRIWRLSISDLTTSGNLFFIGASLSWAYMTIISQFSGRSISALKFSLYVHAVAAITSFTMASISGLPPVSDFSYSFWLNILYLSIISTSFGTTLYFAASQKLGSKTASSFIFIVPLTALLSGIFFLDEKPDMILISGGLTSLLAVYFINSAKSAKILHPSEDSTTG